MKMVKRYKILRLLIVVSAGLVFLPAARAALPLSRDFKHIVSATTDPALEMRRQWLGPVYEHVEWEDERAFRAIRPFYSWTSDPGFESTHTDWLWPLGQWRADGTMRSGRFLLAFFQDFDADDPQSQSRTWVLPFFFSGHSRLREPYTAVFPLGGRIHDFLGADTIRFVLFPLYADSRQGPDETVHVLWPVFSRTHGPQLERWRVFPFYGQATERDGTERRFVLWPIWSSVRSENTDDDGGGFVLFPLFGRVRTEHQSSFTLIPPFFRYSTHPHGTELYYPWPFLQRSTGRVEKNYVWPLWGRKSVPGVDSAFFLWPLGSLGRQERGDSVAIQRTFYPFYFTRRIYDGETMETDSDTGDSVFHVAGRPSERYEKIWPLYSYQRDQEDSVFRIFDLWPGRPFTAIERNLAPFWTLYSRTRTDSGREQELLWGLFRRRVKDSGSRRTQVFPLLAWERDAAGDRRQVSILRGLFRFGTDGDSSFGSIFSVLRWGDDEERP